jgi:predicted Zn-dependent protease with MMP-like domain
VIEIDSKAFEKIVGEAIDSIPKKYADRIKNLAFVVEDIPSPEQRTRLELHEGQTLYGLYEGIPLTRRGAGYNLVLPDKITIFQKPIEASSQTLEQLKQQVFHTVWHEVAHYFGLDHSRIHELESRN